MKIFGLEITRHRKVVAQKQDKLLQQPSGIWTRIFDAFTGAWQQDTAIELNSVLTFGSVFACIRLISADISKLRIKLIEKQASGIWKEVENPAFSPVLRKPNNYQTIIKFIAMWVISKMIHGNTYVLKGRDNRGVVTRLWVLDPTRVTTLISESGDVFYRLARYDLAELAEEVTVPAREMIHDVHFTPEHPLVGVSPIGACGLTTMQGLKIQQNSEKFFANLSNPGGLLIAPGAISDATAVRLKTAFDTNFTGDNSGKLAVLGDGLKYEKLAISATDSQLIEQLRWTGEDVARCFGVPAYKIGIGTMPAYNNIQALAQAYYNDCLQELIECIESLLNEGLNLPSHLGTEFDLDGLMRMDTATRYKAHSDAIGGGWLAPNEARFKEDLEPAPGGDEPFMQQQNWSLEQLSRRTAPTDAPVIPPPQDDPDEDTEEVEDDDTESRLIEALQKRFQEAA